MFTIAITGWQWVLQMFGNVSHNEFVKKLIMQEAMRAVLLHHQQR